MQEHVQEQRALSLLEVFTVLWWNSAGLPEAQIIDHVMETLKGALQMECRLLSPIQLLHYAFFTTSRHKPVTEPAAARNDNI